MFGVPWKHQGNSVNERYRKVEFLIRHPRAHDAFLVGSSLMGAIEPSEVALRLGDINAGRFYNLSFFSAQPAEILAVLKTLAANGVAVRRIVYGLEPIAFSDPKNHGAAYWQHPWVIGDSKLKFWLKNLATSSLSLRPGADKLRDNWTDPSIRFDIETTGRFHWVRYEREIQANHARFIAEKLRPTLSTAGPWIEPHFSDFGELVAWLRQNQVESHLYLNPLHPNLSLAYGPVRLKEFKDRLIQAGTLEQLPDCTHLFDQGANPVYYDFKHFRPLVAGQVLDCALGPSRIATPSPGPSSARLPATRNPL